MNRNDGRSEEDFVKAREKGVDTTMLVMAWMYLEKVLRYFKGETSTRSFKYILFNFRVSK